MKVRLKGNSIRLRLTRPEVFDLVRAGSVTERTEFAGGGVLLTRLESEASAGEIGAEFDGGRIVVRVPRGVIERWGSTDVVGIEHEQPLDGGGSLRVLIEKDFECLTPRAGESQADAFPHPEKAAVCHEAKTTKS